MNSIFRNSKNSKTFDPHIVLFNLTYNIELRRKNMYCSMKCWYLLCMEKYQNLIKNNKFKISAPTWNEEFELLDRSYHISDIQDFI